MKSFQPKSKPQGRAAEAAENDAARPKSAFNSAGAQILSAWITLDSNYAAPIVASFVGMDTGTLVQVGKDAVGCRVFADVVGAAAARGKNRVALLDRLRGSYASVRKC